MFPGVLHSNSHKFGGKFNLETYRMKINNLEEFVKPKDINAKFIKDNYKKCIYSNTYINENYCKKIMSGYKKFLDQLKSDIEIVENNLSKINPEVIKSDNHLSNYSRYVSKISKFTTTVLSGIESYLEALAKYTKMEINQIAKVSVFYNSCFV